MLRKLGLTLALGAAATLVACTHDQPGQVATSAPPGFGFHLLDEGDAAKLAYGEANSDNVGLMLQCAKGSRVVEITDVVRTGSASTLTMISGGRRSELKAEVHSGDGLAMVVARAASAVPALAEFRRTGGLEVSYAGLRYGVAAKPQERPRVERFFAFCDGAA